MASTDTHDSTALPALVLAAGASSRLGRNKLLVEVGGRKVICRAVEALLASPLGPVYVVGGHELSALGAALDPYGDRVRLVENADWPAGKASSIRRGLSAISATASGVLILPGDCPFIEPRLVRALVAEFLRRDRITFPLVRERKGHPVIFPRGAFPRLRGLEGDESLQRFLLDNLSQHAPVAWSDARCIIDIDTPGDLRRARALARRRDASREGGKDEHHRCAAR